MSLTLDRELIAQFIIVLAVCAGAWLILVQPKARETDRLERDLKDAHQTNQFTTPEGIEGLANKLESYNLRLVEIRSYNAVAQDTSVLYGTIMNLAAQHSVEVLAIQPAPLKDTGKSSSIRAARMEIAVQGRFDRVAHFIDEASSIQAFIRPMTLTLMPLEAMGEGVVSARFGCDVLAFDAEHVMDETASDDQAGAEAGLPPLLEAAGTNGGRAVQW